MTTQATLRANNEKFMAAFRAGDPAGIAELYTSGGQLLPPNGDIATGHEAIEAFWNGAMEMGIKEAALETIELDEHGDTAVEVGKFTLFGGDGRTMDSGKYVVVWKNEDGTWKLHRDIWNSSQPPGS